MSGTGPDPVPRLRRGPDPTPNSGRKVLVGVFVFFLLLVGFVMTLVLTIGLHNNGVRPPPRDVLPAASIAPPVAVPAPARFFAIVPDVLGGRAGSTAYVSGNGSESVRPHHLRAVALGVTANGLRAYSAYPLPGCRTEIESVTYRPHFRRVGLVRSADVAVIRGRVQPVPMEVSPDGTKLALVATVPAANGTKCAAQSAAYSLDLKSHAMRLGAGVVTGESTSLAWDPDGKSLDLLAGGTVTRQVIACQGCVPPLVARLPEAKVLLFWHGQLATVAAGAIRAVTSSGLGATLANGLPDGVTTISVDSTGTRLLMSAGMQTVEEPRGVTLGTIYVWSAGTATELPSAHWVNPAW